MRVRELPPRGLVAFGGLVGLVTLLVATGIAPRWPGALHLVALPPLDLAADLRWLLARATGYPSFVAGLVLLVGVRITVLALLLADRDGPRWRLATSVYLVVLVPLLVASQLDFIAHAALYSRLFGVAVAVLGVVVLLVAGAPWAGEVSFGAAWRRNAASGFRVSELAVYLLALVALGTLAQAGGPWSTVALVPLSGVLTIGAVVRLRGAPPARPLLHAAAVAGVAAVAVVSVITTRGAADFQMSEASREGSVIVMSGINSSSGEGAVFELEPGRLGYTCEQFHYFSYAGSGDGQPRGSAACPKREGAPYQPEHTQRPFSEQVDLLAQQVEPLDPPITVLAHSQAAWVAWQAAAEGRLDGVETLVLIGPFPSNPVGFPGPGEPGAGRVGGELFRLFEPVPELVDFDFVVDAPLSRELLAEPEAADSVFEAELPAAVEAIALTSSSDLALLQDGWRMEGATNVCPIREAHPYLPLTPDLHRAVDRYLDGDRTATGCPPWAELYRLATQAFGAPPHDR